MSAAVRCYLNISPRKHFLMDVRVFMRSDLDTDDTIDESLQTQLVRT